MNFNEIVKTGRSNPMALIAWVPALASMGLLMCTGASLPATAVAAGKKAVFEIEVKIDAGRVVSQFEIPNAARASA